MSQNIPLTSPPLAWQLSRYYELVGFKECNATGNSTETTPGGRKLLHDHSHSQHFNPAATTEPAGAGADGSYYHPGSILVKRTTFHVTPAPTSAAASLYQVMIGCKGGRY